MKIIYLTRPGFIVLCAACIFIIGNIILLYKFVGKSTLKSSNVHLVKHFGHHFVPKDHPASHILAHHGKSALKSANDHIVKNLGHHFVPKDHPAADLLAHHVKQQQKENGVYDSTTGNQKAETTLAHDGRDSAAHNNVVNSQQTQLEIQVTQDTVASKTDADGLKTDYVIAVLVIACNRPTVKRCLDQLLKYRPSSERFPIVVSQDCGHAETAAVIRSYGSKLTLIEQPDLSAVEGVPGNMNQFMGYYKISRHYKWALGQVFDKMGYESVVIVEDDLDIAPDFFDYFMATRPLLDKDPTLWCVSAWNDNGKEGMVQGNDILYRTDFFPGLGWMLKKSLWAELKPKWPLGFWDDWMRDPSQRKGRACIRPEICRTRTFGRIGVSHGQFFDEHLQYIKLNDEAYPFLKTDLSYLLQESYDKSFLLKVQKLPVVSLRELLSDKSKIPEVQIQYKDEADFKKLAQSLGPMHDFKAGIPRMAYKGVVTTMFKGTRVYLVPPGI